MKYSNTDVAKQIVLSYLETLANKNMITYERLQEIMAINFDKTNKILLEYIKAIKSIMENAIKELESKEEYLC